MAMVAALAALAGCGGDADSREGLTRAEERQLDEAAARLDAATADYEAGLRQAAEQDSAEAPEH